MTNNLIPIIKGIIGQTEVNTVNGRDLHEFLGVGRDFSNWIKGRVDEYGFTEGQDFVCSPVLASKDGRDFCSPDLGSKNGRGGHNRIDYHLSIDMAKELSMVEKTPKGREARRYFIECERLAFGGQTSEQPGELPRWQSSRYSIPKRIAMFLEANPGDHHNSEIDAALGLVTIHDRRARSVAIRRMSRDGMIQPGRWPHEWSATDLVIGHRHPRMANLRDVRRSDDLAPDSDIAVRLGQMLAAKSHFMDASADLYQSIKHQRVYVSSDYAYPDRSESVQTTYATEAAFYALDRVLDCIEHLSKAAGARA